jgi:WD40 repeat protein
LVVGFLLYLAVVNNVGRGDEPRTDQYGDPLPKGAVARLGSPRLLHDDWIRNLAFFPDGKSLMAATNEPFVRIWDATSGRELRRVGKTDSSLMCAALSPDGRTIAAGENGNAILLWDAASGKENRRITSGLRERVETLVWSPDGRKVAAGGQEKFVHVWDATTGEELLKLRGHRNTILAVAWSSDGKVIASASWDETIRLWDAATGQELRQLEGHLDHMGSLAFAPDGKTLAGPCGEPFLGGGTRSSFRQWDAATGKKFRELANGSYMCVAFAPNGKLLAGGGIDSEIRIWDPASGKELRRLRVYPDRVFTNISALAFSPDSKTLAVGDFNRRIRLWDVTSWEERLPVQGHSGVVNAVVFAPDGKTVVSGGVDRTIRFWDWTSGKELRRSEGVGTRYSNAALTFTADGKALASLEETGLEAPLRLWDPKTGKLLSHFGKKGQFPVAIVFLADNETLAAAEWDGSISLWEPRTGKLLRRVGKHKGRLLALVPMPDGKAVFWAGDYQALGLRDLSSGKDLRRFTGVQHHAEASLAVSPDGTLLASSDPFLLFDAMTGKPMPAWKDGPQRATAMAFSTDGRLLAVAEHHELTLWDIQTGQNARRFTRQGSGIKAVAYAPDGKVVVTASENGTLLVWDVTGRLKAGRLEPIVLKPNELETQWRDLANADAAVAHRALWTLAAGGPQASSYVAKRMEPVSPLEPQKLTQWITDLDNDDFEVREKATKELAKHSEAARAALRRALTDSASAEVRKRVKTLLETMEAPMPTMERLRSWRAVAILEQIADTESRRALEGLAKGAPEARLTREAKAALHRLARDPGKKN